MKSSEKQRLNSQSKPYPTKYLEQQTPRNVEPKQLLEQKESSFIKTENNSVSEMLDKVDNIQQKKRLTIHNIKDDDLIKNNTKESEVSKLSVMVQFNEENKKISIEKPDLDLFKYRITKEFNIIKQQSPLELICIEDNISPKHITSTTDLKDMVLRVQNKSLIVYAGNMSFSYTHCIL